MNTRTAVRAGLASLVVLALFTVWTSGAAAGHLRAGSTKIPISVVKVGPKFGGGEPSIAIASNGIEYVSYPGAATEFFRSLDQGKTWTKGADAESSSGDTSVNTDASGAVYESNLDGSNQPQNALQVDIFKSMDRGKTWPIMGQSTLEPSNSSGQPFFVDRQWVNAWIPPGKTTKQAEVCLSYHDWAPGTVWASCSFDGGKTYDTPVNVITDPTAISDSACDTIPGGTRIVQSGPHAGRIYVAWLAADPLNPATGCNETQATSFHSVWTAFSDDKGATWSDHLVFDGGPLHDGSEIFADLALDNQGNPYTAFVMNLTNSQDPSGQFDMWLEASFDGGVTWNGKTDGTGTPYRVSCCKGTHYFPAVAAGDPGHVVVAYLHTAFVTPALPSGKPDFEQQNNANWRVVVAESLNVKSGHPTWTYRNLQLVHHGNICTLGIACPPGASDRSLLDFIDAQVDPHGFAHVAFTASKAPKGGLKDGIYVANQTGGPSLGRGGHS